MADAPDVEAILRALSEPIPLEVVERGVPAVEAMLHRRLARSHNGEQAESRFRDPVRMLDIKPGPPIRWLVKDLLLAGELGLFVGDGGSFKTTVALHLAAAIAGGYPAFDRYPVIQGPVLFVSEEDGEGVIRNRLDAMIAGHGWDPERVNELHVLALAGVTLVDEGWRQHLMGSIEEIRPVAVFFDPWADLIPGIEENSNTDVGPVVKWLRATADVSGATPVVIHHMGKPGKPGEARRAIDRIRGASRIVHASRQIYAFDDRPSGIAVDCLKLSRAQRPMSMRLARGIQSEPDNKAVWESASITLADSQEQTDAAIRDRMRAYIADHPGCSSNAVAGAALARREVVTAQLAALVDLAEIANTNTEKRPKWFAIPHRTLL